MAKKMVLSLRPKVLSLQRLFSQAAAIKEEFRPVIGLEVHVQLATKTKLFSRAPVIDDSPPNSLVCNFDMAEPGTLPRLNKTAVLHALKIAHLMNCEIPSSCSFDRKHYFYADMPAGYQITQSARPIARNGRFGFHVYSGNVVPYWKETEIIQLQLEQDSGKTIHVGNTSLIDLNRAGVPLVEIVTTPSFTTALEALCFVQQLRLILIHYGISVGDLHKGHMRVDANVSLSRNNIPGVKTEIKNMNSFRHLHVAVNYEINRQFSVLSSGGTIINETRACDSHGRTVSMRDKEEETDYRFLPEPNLPSLKIRDEWIHNCNKELLDVGKPTFQKFIDMGFDPRLAVHYAEDALLCNFVNNCSSDFDKVSTDLFNFWLKELKVVVQKSKAVFPPQSRTFAQHFMSVIYLFQSKRITKLRAIDLLKQYYKEEEHRRPEEVVELLNLGRIQNVEIIDQYGREVFSKNNELVQRAKADNNKAATRLRAAIVEISAKRIDVEDAEACVSRLLHV